MVGPNGDDHRRTGMEEAILHRAGHLTDETGKPVNISDNGRRYANMTLYEMGKHVLEQRGEDVTNWDRMKIAGAALVSRSGGAMSTSDFPIILGNTINRSLRAAYNLTERTFLPFCRQVNASDFKTMTRAQLSEMSAGLEEVKEGGEYKRTSMTEAKEEWKIAKYGRIIPITWETLINDDLNAFARIPQAMANQAAQKQSDIVWGFLTGSHTMGDGVALFHTATHGNLASSGSAIDVDSLGAARKAMRKQKGLTKKDFINVVARFLMVGPDKELEAQKVLTTIIPNLVGNVNVFSNSYELIVEPRITGNTWFMAASPMQIDTIEYGFLDGNEIFTEQRHGFDVDGMEYKIRMTFGAKPIDWRRTIQRPRG